MFVFGGLVRLSVPVTSGLLEKLKAVSGSGGVAGELFLSKFLSGTIDCLALLGTFDVVGGSGTFAGAGGSKSVVVPEHELWLVFSAYANSSVAATNQLTYPCYEDVRSPHVTDIFWEAKCPFWLPAGKSFSFSWDVACDYAYGVYCLRVSV